MSKAFEQGKAEVAALCDYFAKNRAAFCAPGRKEAHVRQDLIDPLFRALGWDVGNAARVAPQYCEVVVEDSLDVEGQQKAPDYTFRVGTLPKFYTEAKKCGVNIFADPAPAYQLRRYGWSAKVAVSILTDFEELGVYDCTMRPRPGDKASHARILYYRFDEYPDRWRELWDIFSREAVWAGAFDQYAASKRKRGTSEVDVEFLKELEGWRDELARNMALRNPTLSGDELNRAVQLTIDRVVFLRMAEDRGLEPCEQLLTLCEQAGIYESYMKLCRKADDRYNSGLFHFQKETGVSEAPDQITPKLTVDDKVLKPILQSLYFAHGSPYEFKVLPVEILGTVYERFLGKVIRLTAGHQAKVEEKPEVRKAGGVYYTPAYIVNYIVAQTVGRHIEGKSPAQLAGGGTAFQAVRKDQPQVGKPVPRKQPLRVLDMACGSGSFLLGAYQCLLDHCLKWYIDNGPEGFPKAVLNVARPPSGAPVQPGPAGPQADWRLTIAEKKRILVSHVFGVDIDPQAVEVSKLSLLLKVLEGESAETVGDSMRLFHERALPNLSDNIKCGNSLIGPDYFTGRLIPDAAEFARVNAFDWKREFPAAMKAGGFDCVIGNPPYIRIQTMKETAPLEVEIYKELFKTAREGNYDIYVVFIEQGLKFLNAKGRLGFICPHKFFNAKYGAPVRGVVADGQHLAHVVHFGDQQVFDGATTYTCLLFLDKSPAKECRFVQVKDLVIWKTPQNGTHGPPGEEVVADGTIAASRVTSAEWNLHVGNGKALFARLSRMPVKLGDLADVFVGLQTSADPVFLFKDVPALKGKTVPVRSKQLDEIVSIETELLKPVVRSGSIGRYAAHATAAVLFPYAFAQGKAALLSESVMRTAFPKTWAYLRRNMPVLAEREHGKFRATGWYQLYPKNLDLWEQPKILVPYMITRLSAYYDTDNNYFVNVTTGGFGITVPPERGDLRYFTGLLNSRLLNWVMKNVSTTFHGGYFAANKQFLVQLPIRVLDLDARRDKEKHDRMVSLVDSMQALHRQLASAKSQAVKGVAIQRRIEVTDAAIDRLVYVLYGLTKDEIAIVEGK